MSLIGGFLLMIILFGGLRYAGEILGGCLGFLLKAAMVIAGIIIALWLVKVVIFDFIPEIM